MYRKMFNKAHFSYIVLRDIEESEVKTTNIIAWLFFCSVKILSVWLLLAFPIMHHSYFIQQIISALFSLNVTHQCV